MSRNGELRYVLESTLPVASIRTVCAHRMGNYPLGSAHASDSRVAHMRIAELACGHTQNHPETVSQSVTAFCDACQTVQYIASVKQVEDASPILNGTQPQRSYGCSFGCGNPYDYVFVSVADGTTEFPCLPCFVKLAADIVAAVTSGEGAEMMAALADMAQTEQAPMTRGKLRKRGHEAPANADDPDLIEAFDSRITEDELPDDFK